MSPQENGPVLVADAGSSSLRLTVFGGDGEVLAEHHDDTPPGKGARDALRRLLDEAPAPVAVGHRIVHGGPELRGHTPVDDEVRARLDRVADLAPLHVPPALTVLDAARELLPDVPHVACFDTVFHAGLPAAAREYAVPEAWREGYRLRRYGFHGLSYAWALDRAAELLGRPADRLRLVIAHLGGGCSVCAVREGRSVDTTMGFTPLEGLVMSHRSGSVDPGALTWLQTRHGLTADAVEHALNHESGLLGLSGTSDDTRDLVRARAAGTSGPRSPWTSSPTTAAAASRRRPRPWTGSTPWSSPARSARTSRKCARRCAPGCPCSARRRPAAARRRTPRDRQRARRTGPGPRRAHRGGPAGRPRDPGAPGGSLRPRDPGLPGASLRPRDPAAPGPSPRGSGGCGQASAPGAAAGDDQAQGDPGEQGDRQDGPQGSVTSGTHRRMVTEPVLAAMNQTARAASSTKPMVRSRTSRPLTVTLDGGCSFAVFSAMRSVSGGSSDRAIRARRGRRRRSQEDTRFRRAVCQAGRAGGLGLGAAAALREEVHQGQEGRADRDGLGAEGAQADAGAAGRIPEGVLPGVTGHGLQEAGAELESRPAADEDAFGLEEVDQVGESGAEELGGLLQDGERGGVGAAPVSAG